MCSYVHVIIKENHSVFETFHSFDRVIRDMVILYFSPQYQLYGEPVVKACISQKCNYVDITGETYVSLLLKTPTLTYTHAHTHTQFMEDMAARYDEQAREAGVYIVFSCGFDSIPNDMGALLLQRTFNGELSYVESYMAVHDGVSYMFASVQVLSCHTHTHSHTHRVASMLELGNRFSAV